MAEKSDEQGSAASGGGKKKQLMAGAVLVIVAAAGWWFFMRPDKGAEEALPPPVPGEVIKLEPITINLANGHFLKLGLALQPTAEGAEEVDGSRALDLAIAQLSGRAITELAKPEDRQRVKAELIARIKLAYVPHEAEGDEASEGGTESEGDAESEEGEDAAKGEEAAETTPGHAGEDLSAEEAIKEAAELKVQPLVYDAYFTEFVMQ